MRSAIELYKLKITNINDFTSKELENIDLLVEQSKNKQLNELSLEEYAAKKVSLKIYAFNR